MGLISLIIFAVSLASSLKYTKVKLHLLTDVNILSMVQKAIKGVICHATHPYVNLNNKYMKNNYKNKESTCFK